LMKTNPHQRKLVGVFSLRSIRSPARGSSAQASSGRE